MKTVRMILPALAFVFAVAGAFASNLSKEASTVTTVDVASNITACVKVGTCTEGGDARCTNSSGNELYKKGTSCSQFFGTNFVSL